MRIQRLAAIDHRQRLATQRGEDQADHAGRVIQRDDVGEDVAAAPELSAQREVKRQQGDRSAADEDAARGRLSARIATQGQDGHAGHRDDRAEDFAEVDAFSKECPDEKWHQDGIEVDDQRRHRRRRLLYRDKPGDVMNGQRQGGGQADEQVMPRRPSMRSADGTPGERRQDRRRGEEPDRRKRRALNMRLLREKDGSSRPDDAQQENQVVFQHSGIHLIRWRAIRLPLLDKTARFYTRGAEQVSFRSSLRPDRHGGNGLQGRAMSCLAAGDRAPAALASLLASERPT